VETTGIAGFTENGMITASATKNLTLDAVLQSLDLSMRIMRPYFKNHCNFPGFDKNEFNNYKIQKPVRTA